MIRYFLLFCTLLTASASAGFLNKLPDHPYLTIDVAVGGKLCTIGWNREEGKTTYTTSVKRVLKAKAGTINMGASDIKDQPENVPVVEIFELAKAAEAEMPKFDAPAVAPAGAGNFSFQFSQGSGGVSWEVLAKPDSKLAVAVTRLQTKIVSLLTEEQLSEFEKVPPLAGGSSRPGANPEVEISAECFLKQDDLLITRTLSISGKGGAKPEILTKAGSSFFHEKNSDFGPNHPEKKFGETEVLPKWPQPEISRLLTAYAKEAQLVGEKPRTRTGVVNFFNVTYTSGEGRMVTSCYGDEGPSRIRAWQDLCEGLKKMMTGKQLKALDSAGK